MAIFEIQGADGKTYEVDAPDAQTAAQTIAGMKPQNPVIATTNEGKVYRMPDGSLSFSSPGMSTSNPDTIAKIMEGATPADASTYGNVNEGGNIGAAARSALQGLTFGGGDEIVAAGASLFGPNSYETELARERARLDKGRDKHGATSAISEIAGALTLPLGAMKSAGSLPVRMAKSAGVGGLLSGLYGFGAGEGGAGERVKDATMSGLLGAGIGAAIPMVGAGVQKALDRRAASKAISAGGRNAPTSEALRAEGDAAYRAIDAADVKINPSDFQTTAGDIVSKLRAGGLDEGGGALNLTPKSARVADILTEAGQTNSPISFGNLDQMRRKAGVAASDVQAFTGRPTLDSKLGTGAIEGLDDFVQNLTPDQATGDIDALKTLIPKARELWSRMSRSQLVESAITAGNENYLSGASSGIRNQFKRILSNPKLVRGFSEAEVAAMRRVVNGSMPEQILNLLGGGLGQLAAVTGSSAIGGPLGFVAGTGAAAALRKGAELATQRRAEIARALVANGTVKNLPVANPQTRAIIERLMRQGTAASLQ